MSAEGQCLKAAGFACSLQVANVVHQAAGECASTSTSALGTRLLNPGRFGSTRCHSAASGPKCFQLNTSTPPCLLIATGTKQVADCCASLPARMQRQGSAGFASQSDQTFGVYWWEVTTRPLKQWHDQFKLVPVAAKLLGLAGAIPFIALAEPVVKHLDFILPAELVDNAAMLQVGSTYVA